MKKSAFFFFLFLVSQSSIASSDLTGIITNLTIALENIVVRWDEAKPYLDTYAPLSNAPQALETCGYSIACGMVITSAIWSTTKIALYVAQRQREKRANAFAYNGAT